MIAIFPGHIGKDAGTVGKTDDGFYFVESAVNISISHKVSKLLDHLGVKNEIYLGTLQEKVEKSKGSTLGISIHSDYISDSRVSGYHIMQYPGSLGGDLLSCLIDEELEDFNILRARSPHTRDDLYILKKTAFPTILIETGFLSNSEDCKNLHDIKYQYRIAYAIVNGIVKYNKTGIHEL